ncbi:MAG: 2-amino-4-hydroxy-6-hydroxymethyldihydropteridine diphosphokinase, partial [Pseudomonadota bacterium]|nr:2-amino-4-hydroxy-6-hydroxymethyldihydropteridine diphosphokinase [Pseudomonadota bacterium]
MSQLTGGYLLGLGSNINPQQNFAAIVRHLLDHFDALHLSRVLHIPPVGMNSHRDFLNAVAFLETDIPEAEL